MDILLLPLRLRLGHTDEWTERGAAYRVLTDGRSDEVVTKYDAIGLLVPLWTIVTGVGFALGALVSLALSSHLLQGCALSIGGALFGFGAYPAAYLTTVQHRIRRGRGVEPANRESRSKRNAAWLLTAIIFGVGTAVIWFR